MEKLNFKLNQSCQSPLADLGEGYRGPTPSPLMLGKNELHNKISWQDKHPRPPPPTLTQGLYLPQVPTCFCL